jgi:hypothetical protein
MRDSDRYSVGDSDGMLRCFASHSRARNLLGEKRRIRFSHCLGSVGSASSVSVSCTRVLQHIVPGSHENCSEHSQVDANQIFPSLCCEPRR